MWYNGRSLLGSIGWQMDYVVEHGPIVQEVPAEALKD